MGCIVFVLGVRQGKWKLLGNKLYDLSSDIGEKNNIAAKYPEIVKKLKSLLQQHKKDIKAQHQVLGKMQK